MSLRFKSTRDSPSTPNRKANRSLATQPSTTPAGPPPTWLTNQSTTPGDPPPRKLFGSSFNPANNTFGPRGNTPARRGFTVPESSPLQDGDEDEGEDAEGEDAEEMDGVQDQSRLIPPPTEQSAFLSSFMSSPRGLKRSRNGQVREQRPESDYPAIARGITSHARLAVLSESDDLLLSEEEVLSEMMARRDNLSSAQEGATRLAKLWAKHSDSTTREGKIGPAVDDPITKANYLAALLLQLHHPHTVGQAKPPGAQSWDALSRKPASSACSVPRALLDWLDLYHNPFPDDFRTVLDHQPNPSHHERFWDTIYVCLTRGRFQQAIQLLREAGWENAATAEEDGRPDGYSDRQLDNIEEVAERFARVLQASPAVQYDDWDVKGNDWQVYRQSVFTAVKDLEQFAGDENDEAGALTKSGRNLFSVSAASKIAESRIPWSVYTNIKLSYDILLGRAEEIMDASQDWLEASIYITAWWDGDSSEAGSLGLSRASLRRSLTASQKAREVDVTPTAAYRKHLADAFTYVTDTEDPLFLPDPMDDIHVGLGCIMAGDVESVLGLLRTWSLPVTVGVLDVASNGDWLSKRGRHSQALLDQGFSSEDLMVLSHGPDRQLHQMPSQVDRDEVLIEYADHLARKDVLRSSNGVEREGWELAVSVLGRMPNEEAAQHKVGEILQKLEVKEDARVDKILRACLDLGLAEEARAISERYADSLTNSTQSYGSALIYYARANATDKLKNTLALLTSLCLLHSAAVPSKADLDPQLASLLSNDRSALITLGQTDGEAVSTLQAHLSGYALLRTFYDVRDQIATGTTLKRPLERMRKAAEALICVLESASSCIHGGLFDPEIESVVPVDGVLALLGEALPLLGQPKRLFKKDQVFTLLRIAEDFSTVSGRIRENAESLLKASVSTYRGDSPESSWSMLKKSKSDLGSASGPGGLGGSSWDLLAESVMRPREESDANGKSASGVQRGWDWRQGLDGIESGADVGAKEVLMLVRVALAKEVARGWTGEIRWAID
ncbi:hypothetical protein BAUCODRAFT_65665 [Baudoinia panamericana UAMH 10762]|uniref:Nuclear pore complex protein Nup85 n=1 Tax=Baudoinia panamericana (strain UAMH 10762) TaxID=717646 RepID=M2MQM3_BAUPA|nr:uncharacterized protein BAUCODRAFT_65665 [Baudoinia panamericana UAMH 10762]EMC99101.1 hypothetical protein BAUCODRAFT_65665 [Baudoinia panamericana UAMH 10762]